MKYLEIIITKTIHFFQYGGMHRDYVIFQAIIIILSIYGFKCLSDKISNWWRTK